MNLYNQLTASATESTLTGNEQITGTNIVHPRWGVGLGQPLFLTEQNLFLNEISLLMTTINPLKVEVSRHSAKLRIIQHVLQYNSNRHSVATCPTVDQGL